MLEFSVHGVPNILFKVNTTCELSITGTDGFSSAIFMTTTLNEATRAGNIQFKYV